LRVVGDGGTDTDDNAVHQRPQPVQMGEARGSVDVFGMTGLRGNAAVERLPDLPNNHNIVHRTPPQRAE
jgi:hypothetical protein